MNKRPASPSEALAAPRAGGGAGFTLVEMLVVIVIEAMIVTALGSAFVLVMNNSTTVKESLARTNDARFAASYIVSDARNSSGPETSLSDISSCPDPSPPVSGSATPVVRFNWNSTSSSGAIAGHTVNYVRVASTLLRRLCLNGNLVSDVALAANVASATVACAPTADCSGTPTTMTATIIETQGSSLGAAYQYSLTGAFRKALAVGFPLLSISGPASLAAWTINRPYPSTTMSGTGGGGTYIWSATGLPAGLTINASTGAISGTPTAAGAPTATITLNDSLGDTPATRQYTVTINAAPSIPASPLPTGDQTVAYSATLAKSGGTAAYTWSATGLPAGLALDASTGVISGTPTAAGTSTVAVTLTDAAGAVATRNLSLTINPLPTISSVALQNAGATAGLIEKSDKMVVTFSAQMRVSSFCSTWSGDGANQNLVANNDVTVTVNDGTGATNDSITVTSATCTFQFGSINLGSGAYVSGGAATFAGSTGATRSTIAWSSSTRTLTITFGAMTAGTVATVATSTPIYTASSSIVSSGGAALSNSPFTLAAAKQF